MQAYMNTYEKTSESILISLPSVDRDSRLTGHGHCCKGQRIKHPISVGVSLVLFRISYRFTSVKEGGRVRSLTTVG